MLATLLHTVLAAAAAAAPASTTVQVQTTIPARCISVYQDAPEGTHLLVSGQTLEKLGKRDADGLPLDERMTRIMGARANALLQAAKDAKPDAQGCQPVSLASLHDTGYVVMPLIDAGRVAVWSDTHHALVPSITTRQSQCSLDAPLGGFSASVAGEPAAFLAMVTCVT